MNTETNNPAPLGIDPNALEGAIDGLHGAFVGAPALAAGAPEDFGTDQRTAADKLKVDHPPRTLLEWVAYAVIWDGNAPTTYDAICEYLAHNGMPEHHEALLTEAGAKGIVMIDGDKGYTLDTAGIELAVERGWMDAAPEKPALSLNASRLLGETAKAACAQLAACENLKLAREVLTGERAAKKPRKTVIAAAERAIAEMEADDNACIAEDEVVVEVPAAKGDDVKAAAAAPIVAPADPDPTPTLGDVDVTADLPDLAGASKLELYLLERVQALTAQVAELTAKPARKARTSSRKVELDGAKDAGDFNPGDWTKDKRGVVGVVCRKTTTRITLCQLRPTGWQWNIKWNSATLGTAEAPEAGLDAALAALDAAGKKADATALRAATA